jgi:putative component of toxin-antitoxin plasmid stabilization module
MEVLRRAIRIYQRESGERPFVTWMRSLRDVRGKQAIEARLARVSLGNLGKRGQPPPYCESGS